MLGAISVTVLLCSGAVAQEFKTPEGVPVKIEADSLSYDNERDVYFAEGNVDRKSVV